MAKHKLARRPKQGKKAKKTVRLRSKGQKKVRKFKAKLKLKLKKKPLRAPTVQKKEAKTFRIAPHAPAAQAPPEMYTVKNYIDGTWRVSHSRQAFQSLNPANSRDVVGNITSSNIEDVDQAAAAARFHFQSWGKKSPEERSRILFRAAQLLADDREVFSNILLREIGTAKAEADLEVVHAIDTARYYAGKALDLEGLYVEGATKTDIFMKRVAVGVFIIITPWTHPLQTAVARLFACLSTGNTIVFKPSRRSAVCSMLLVKILERAGLPPGVLNLINGSGNDLGSYLTGHAEVDGVSFTGSTNTGKIIGGSCGARFKKHELHMSGHCAMIVTQHADIDKAVIDGLIGSFRGAGQYHNSTARIIIEDAVYDKFRKKFAEGMAQLVIAPGDANPCDIPPLRDEATLRRVHEAIRAAKNEDHARISVGGNQHMSKECRNGWFFEPTLIEGVIPQMHVSHQEILGPVVCFIRAKDENEAVTFANNSRYGLVTSVYTDNIKQAYRIAEKLDCGVVHINQPTTATDTHVVFGGVKDSGNGHRSGRLSIDVFTKWQTVSVSKE